MWRQQQGIPNEISPSPDLRLRGYLPNYTIGTNGEQRVMIRSLGTPKFSGQLGIDGNLIENNIGDFASSPYSDGNMNIDLIPNSFHPYSSQSPSPSSLPPIELYKNDFHQYNINDNNNNIRTTTNISFPPPPPPPLVQKNNNFLSGGIMVTLKEWIRSIQGNTKGQFTSRRAILFSIILIWVLVIWGVLGVKVFAGEVHILNNDDDDDDRNSSGEEDDGELDSLFQMNRKETLRTKNGYRREKPIGDIHSPYYLHLIEERKKRTTVRDDGGDLLMTMTNHPITSTTTTASSSSSSPINTRVHNLDTRNSNTDQLPVTNGDRAADTFSYFTNITLALQGLFYTAYLFIFLESPIKRRLETFLLVWVWWIILAQIILVFILVLGVIYDNPGLVTDEMKTNGGSYEDGQVLLAERLFHVFPLIFAMLFLYCVRSDIGECMTRAFGFIPLRIRQPTTNLGTTNNDQSAGASATPTDYLLSQQERRKSGIENVISSPTIITASHEKYISTQSLDIPEKRIILVETFGWEKREIKNTDLLIQVENYVATVDTKVQILYTISQFILACAPFLIYTSAVSVNDRYGISDILSTEWLVVIATAIISAFSVILPQYGIFNYTIQTKQFDTEFVKSLLYQSPDPVVMKYVSLANPHRFDNSRKCFEREQYAGLSIPIERPK
jgi:hypothetical protein